MFEHPQQTPTTKKIRYYRDIHGRIYRSMFVGYHYDTDEQCVVLRELATGRISIVPKQELYEVVMQNNQYMQKFTELHNFYDPYHDNQRATPHVEYPGYTDDPRTFNRAPRRPYR